MSLYHIYCLCKTGEVLLVLFLWSLGSLLLSSGWIGRTGLVEMLTHDSKTQTSERELKRYPCRAVDLYVQTPACRCYREPALTHDRNEEASLGGYSSPTLLQPACRYRILWCHHHSRYGEAVPYSDPHLCFAQLQIPLQVCTWYLPRAENEVLSIVGPPYTQLFPAWAQLDPEARVWGCSKSDWCSHFPRKPYSWPKGIPESSILPLCFKSALLGMRWKEQLWPDPGDSNTFNVCSPRLSQPTVR